MAGFDKVIGHERIIEHFQDAVKLGRLSHAYILSGEEGAGKRLLAHLFSMALLCERKNVSPDSVPCMECRSCKQAEGHNHPDIIWVSHEKPGSIGVEDVRGQVVGDMQIKPYSSPYKLYIIDEAEKLTVQAQNALLKTIEEPPEYGLVIFLTTNAEGFLPTILSRCVTFHLRPASNSDVMCYLTERLSIGEERARLCAAFAQGNVGRAVRFASSEEFDGMKSHALGLAQGLSAMRESEIPEAVQALAGYRENINDYLDILLVWFRDVLLFKVTKDANAMVLRDEVAEATKSAAQSSYEGLEEIIAAIGRARARLRANVNFDLAMELLLLTIKEN